MGREKAGTDIKGFLERMQAVYFMRGTFRMRQIMQKMEGPGTEMTGDGKRREAGEKQGTPYKSTYRDVYGHSPLAGDLPSCYGTSEGDFMRDTPAGQKAEARNFGSYLKLFDLLMQRGLNELNGLKRLLSIDDADSTPSRMETLPEKALACPSPTTGTAASRNYGTFTWISSTICTEWTAPRSG